MTVMSYRDLLVWQKSMALVTEVYRGTRGFPREEIYGLTSQMRRAAVSIPSNIAEGYGRNSTQDYVRFLRMASGSLYELQTQLEIAVNLNYFDKTMFETLYSASSEAEKMLSCLINKLVRSIDGTA